MRYKVIGKYKYLGGPDDNLEITKNKVYKRIYNKNDPDGFYIIDDSGEHYLYNKDYFSIVNTPKRKSKKIICPECKGKLLDIVYGMPGPELFEKAEKQEVYLGGCCIDENNPKYFCPKCHREYFENLKDYIDEKLNFKN